MNKRLKIRRRIILSVLAVLLCYGGLAQATVYEWTSGTYEIADGNNYGMDWINLRNSAIVNMTGGNLGVLYAYDSSKFNLQGGNVGAILQFYGTSTANVTGGFISSGFNMYDNTVLSIGGGILNGVKIDMDNSNILNLFGGIFGTGNLTPWIYSKGIINIYGRDLSIVPYYTQVDSIVSGHWADGSAFGFILGRDQIYNPQIVFHEIPEPCMIVLVGFGFFIVRRTIKIPHK